MCEGPGLSRAVYWRSERVFTSLPQSDGDDLRKSIDRTDTNAVFELGKVDLRFHSVDMEPF